MQIALLQLSDIHVKSGRDMVLSRAKHIKDAFHSAAPHAAAVIIVLTGDVAFSGQTAQYDAAKHFLDDLRSQLLSLPSIKSVDFVAIPGNHDCDFTKESDIRQYLLKDTQELYKSGLESGSDRTKAILEVQKNFFHFEAVLRGGKELDYQDRLAFAFVLRFGNYSVNFQCFNTAWLSRNPEIPSKLFLPDDALQPRAVEASLCISLFHHPYNWLDTTNSRLLRDLIEQTSDLVYTGHEHVAGGGKVDRFSGSYLQYIEAEALQGEKGELDSGFNVLPIDFVTSDQRLERFGWNGEAYVSKDRQQWNSIVKNPARERHLFRVNRGFRDALSDPGSPFTHRRVRSLTLTDIYVYPDLRPTSFQQFSKGKLSQRIYSKDVPAHIRSGSEFLVTGPDNGGKTAFLKALYLELSRDFIPVLLDGKRFGGKLSEGRFRNILAEAVELQYDADSVERFFRLDPSQRVLLMDNFQNANLNSNAEGKFTIYAHDLFGHVIVTVSEIHRITELSKRHTEIDPFKTFERLELSDFGHRLRAKLIYKWLSLGRETASELESLDYEARATEKIITTLLGKNVVPPTPFNVLTLLHTIESSQFHSTAIGSYGALYELLIKASLSISSSDGSKADVHFNFASLVAYRMFEEERRSLAESDLRRVKSEYYDIFHIDPDLNRMLTELVAARVFERSASGGYGFKYKHLYYYFVAKYFERVLKRPGERAAALRTKLNYLADRLHSEEAANIVLFYLHFAQDYELIQHLLNGAREIYRSLEPCDCDSHAAFVNKLYVEPPKKLVFPDDDVEAHREEYHQKADESEDQGGDGIALDAKVTYNEQLSDIHKINIAFKTLQVLGQVLCSSAHLMEGDLKLEIATECYLLGLRALRALLMLVENNVDDLRLYFSALIKERAAFLDLDHELTEEKLLKWTDEGVIWLTHMSAFGTIKKISYAVGHESLVETYERILSSHGKSIGVSLADLGIKLDHFSLFPEFDVNSLRDKTVRNRFAYSVLRTMVTDYLYLYRVDARVQQKLGALFDIENVTKPRLLLPLPDDD
jgi:hypothetical protein